MRILNIHASTATSAGTRAAPSTTTTAPKNSKKKLESTLVGDFSVNTIMDQNQRRIFIIQQNLLFLKVLRLAGDHERFYSELISLFYFFLCAIISLRTMLLLLMINSGGTAA